MGLLSSRGKKSRAAKEPQRVTVPLGENSLSTCFSGNSSEQMGKDSQRELKEAFNMLKRGKGNLFFIGW